jgi:hypothetical protein
MSSVSDLPLLANLFVACAGIPVDYSCGRVPADGPGTPARSNSSPPGIICGTGDHSGVETCWRSKGPHRGQLERLLLDRKGRWSPMRGDSDDEFVHAAERSHLHSAVISIQNEAWMAPGIRATEDRS